jgi:hypothetical protein
VPATTASSETIQRRLLSLADSHECSRHPLFEHLETAPFSLEQAAAFLKNYDCHASVLRRLLLAAATLMPEPAVGFVLENVRNEYGNGDYSRNHQAQLRDLAASAGISDAMFESAAIEKGIEDYISQARIFYGGNEDSRQDAGAPRREQVADQSHFLPAAVAAGAITTTELMAIKEFAAMQKAFTRFGLKHHIWFHHVTIEQEHLDDSLALAMYFINEHDAFADVESGMQGMLSANVHLYDGLLAAIRI